MSCRMPATASAWARMFSPVSSCSQASKGSAKARARIKAWAWCGRLSGGRGHDGRRHRHRGQSLGKSGGRAFHVSRSLCPKKVSYHGHLVVAHQGGRMSDASEFDTPRLRTAPAHLLCCVTRSKSESAPRSNKVGERMASYSLQSRLASVQGLARARLVHRLGQGLERFGNGRVIVQPPPPVACAQHGARERRPLFGRMGAKAGRDGRRSRRRPARNRTKG